MIENILNDYVAPLLPYLWEFVAIIVMPFVAMRVANFAKKLNRKLAGDGHNPAPQLARRAAWHWALWQGLNLSTCWAGAYYCLSQKYPEHAAFGAVVIAAMSGVFTDLIIKWSEKNKPTLHDALTNGVILTDDPTLMHTVIGVTTGAKVKRDHRGAPR